MDPNTPARFCKIDIRVPRLRKCPFDLDTVDWRHAKLLGTGMDGCVWRVRFGKDSLYYALKLFWDADPEKLEGCYFAAQRECQNAALLQSMRASLDQEAAAQAVLDSGGTFPDGEGNGPGANPTLVFVNPKDEEEAACNLYMYRRDRDKLQDFVQTELPETMRMRDVPMPRFVQCHGWLRMNAKELIAQMPYACRPGAVYIKSHQYRYFQEGPTEFIAIVYEYIQKDRNDEVKHGAANKKITLPGRNNENNNEDSDNYGPALYGRDSQREKPKKEEPEKGKLEQLDPKEGKEGPSEEEKNKVLAVERFLHLAGFQFCPQPLRTNWINGILVDHSDIVAPCFFGWHKRWYHPRTIEVLMAE
ncbi:hypothetical protein SEUCBS139899_006735 [Sporothrix eucalyptigena]